MLDLDHSSRCELKSLFFNFVFEFPVPNTNANSFAWTLGTRYWIPGGRGKCSLWTIAVYGGFLVHCSSSFSHARFEEPPIIAVDTRFHNCFSSSLNNARFKEPLAMAVDASFFNHFGSYLQSARFKKKWVLSYRADPRPLPLPPALQK